MYTIAPLFYWMSIYQTPLNSLLSYHCFNRGIREEIEFENFKMLNLRLSEENNDFFFVAHSGALVPHRMELGCLD